jgi:hypothetical protein
MNSAADQRGRHRPSLVVKVRGPLALVLLGRIHRAAFLERFRFNQRMRTTLPALSMAGTNSEGMDLEPVGYRSM